MPKDDGKDVVVKTDKGAFMKKALFPSPKNPRIDQRYQNTAARFRDDAIAVLGPALANKLEDIALTPKTEGRAALWQKFCTEEYSEWESARRRVAAENSGLPDAPPVPLAIYADFYGKFCRARRGTVYENNVLKEIAVASPSDPLADERSSS